MIELRVQVTNLPFSEHKFGCLRMLSFSWMSFMVFAVKGSGTQVSDTGPCWSSCLHLNILFLTIFKTVFKILQSFHSGIFVNSYIRVLSCIFSVTLSRPFGESSCYARDISSLSLPRSFCHQLLLVLQAVFVLTEIVSNHFQRAFRAFYQSVLDCNCLICRHG